MPASPFVRTAVATALFGLVHSAMADHRVKDAVERTLGPRTRNAVYRPLYNAVSVVTLGGLTAFILKQPKRTLYKVEGPAAVAMRVGQLAGFGITASAAWHTGPLKFAGLPSVWAYLTRQKNVPRPPAGQGPDRFADGTVKAVGPFARIRQPANMGMVPLLCLNPTMTTRFAGFCAVTALYAVVGSVHSDRVLRREYGPAYDAYRRRVPMLLPKVR